MLTAAMPFSISSLPSCSFSFDKILMRPGMRADGVASGRDLFHDFRMPAGVLADREEHRLGALIGQRFEHGRCMSRPRPVVERQHDFVVTQKVIRLEMLEAEAGAAGGVDLDDAGNSECIRIVAFCCCGCRLPRPQRAAGAGACAFWAQAVVAADIEIARAIAKALRITFSMRSRCPYS